MIRTENYYRQNAALIEEHMTYKEDTVITFVTLLEEVSTLEATGMDQNLLEVTTQNGEPGIINAMLGKEANANHGYNRKLDTYPQNPSYFKRSFHPNKN